MEKLVKDVTFLNFSRKRDISLMLQFNNPVDRGEIFRKTKNIFQENIIFTATKLKHLYYRTGSLLVAVTLSGIRSWHFNILKKDCLGIDSWRKKMSRTINFRSALACELSSKFPKNWAVVADEGYTCLNSNIPLIVPKKKITQWILYNGWQKSK